MFLVISLETCFLIAPGSKTFTGPDHRKSLQGPVCQSSLPGPNTCESVNNESSTKNNTI